MTSLITVPNNSNSAAETAWKNVLKRRKSFASFDSTGRREVVLYGAALLNSQSNNYLWLEAALASPGNSFSFYCKEKNACACHM